MSTLQVVENRQWDTELGSKCYHWRPTDTTWQRGVSLQDRVGYVKYVWKVRDLMTRLTSYVTWAEELIL